MNGVFAVMVVMMLVATLAGFGSVMVMAAPPYPCTYTAYDWTGEVVRSVRRHTCVYACISFFLCCWYYYSRRKLTLYVVVDLWGVNTKV